MTEVTQPDNPRKDHEAPSSMRKSSLLDPRALGPTMPGSIVLGLDTCGPTGTLALVRVLGPYSSPADAPEHQQQAPELEILAEAVLAGKTTAAMLVPTLRAILADASIALSQIAAVVVVDGPGSFTGIRIGLSAAKALAETLNLPVYPISRLRVLAHIHSATGAVLDAGRGEFYLGHYPAGSDHVEIVLPREELITYLDAAARPPLNPVLKPVLNLVTCESKVTAAFPLIHLPMRLVDQPTAASAIAAALNSVLLDPPAHVATLDGRYIRRSNLYRTSEPSSPIPA